MMVIIDDDDDDGPRHDEDPYLFHIRLVRSTTVGDAEDR